MRLEIAKSHQCDRIRTRINSSSVCQTFFVKFSIKSVLKIRHFLVKTKNQENCDFCLSRPREFEQKVKVSFVNKNDFLFANFLKISEKTWHDYSTDQALNRDRCVQF